MLNKAPNNNHVTHVSNIMLNKAPNSHDTMRVGNNLCFSNDLCDDEHQQDQGITVANASNITCHGMCSGNTTNHTSLMSTFAAAMETDLKCDLRIYRIIL